MFEQIAELSHDCASNFPLFVRSTKRKILGEAFCEKNLKLFSVQTRMRSRLIIPSTDHNRDTNTQVTRNTMSINYISLKFRIKFTERNEGEKERGKERERESIIVVPKHFFLWSNVINYSESVLEPRQATHNFFSPRYHLIFNILFDERYNTFLRLFSSLREFVSFAFYAKFCRVPLFVSLIVLFLYY